MSRRTLILRTIRRAGSLQWLLIGVLGATTLVCIGGLIAYGLWRAQPSYWSDANVAAADALVEAERRAALDLERRMISLVGSTPRAEKVAIPLSAANAWLHERLGDWLSHQQPAAGEEKSEPGRSRAASTVRACRPMLAIDSGRLVLAFRLPLSRGATVHSLLFEPAAVSPRRMGLRLAAARMGRLPLPLAAVRSRLQSIVGQLDSADAAWLTAALSGDPFDPLAGSDGDGLSSNWRLTNLKLHGQEVDLAFDAAAP